MERVRFQRRSMNVLTTGCLKTWCYQYDEENHDDNLRIRMMLLMMMNERRRRKRRWRRILLQQSCSASGGGRWLLSYFVGPRPQDTCKIAVIIVIMTMITVIPVILITIIVINQKLQQHHHHHHNHIGNNHYCPQDQKEFRSPMTDSNCPIIVIRVITSCWNAGVKFVWKSDHF